MKEKISRIINSTNPKGKEILLSEIYFTFTLFLIFLTPIILYISGSAGVLERMAKTGVDIISLDWTVDIEEACKRIPDGIGIQGNVDPGILFGNKESIKERIDNTFNKIKDRKYILNLGHGILPGTPEENAQTFFEHGKKLTY